LKQLLNEDSKMSKLSKTIRIVSAATRLPQRAIIISGTGYLTSLAAGLITTGPVAVIIGSIAIGLTTYNQIKEELIVWKDDDGRYEVDAYNAALTAFHKAEIEANEAEQKVKQSKMKAAQEELKAAARRNKIVGDDDPTISNILA
jgi:hypothetical protein